MHNNNLKFNIGISLLKIISTILIVFHHYQQITGLRFKNFVNFYGGGVYFGYIVELFFIISGFLTYSYISRIKNNEVTFDKFYLKKYLRFYPHIIISIVVYLIVNYLYKLKFGSYDFIKSINPLDFLISSVGIQRWGMFKDPGYNNPLWYVSVLMVCYIVFYFVCYISKKFDINESIMFLLVILIGLYIVNQNINFLFLNTNIYRGYVAFFIGTLIAGLRSIKINILCLIIPIILIAYLFCFPNRNIQYYISTFVIFPLIVLYFSRINFTSKIFVRAISFFEKYVFCTFVWHAVLLLLYKYLELPASGHLMIIFTACCWGMGMTYYHLIGTRINKIVKKLNNEGI